MRNISKIFSALLQRVGPSSRFCYEFGKMTIECNLFIFSAVFTISDSLSGHLQKSKNFKLIIIGFWLIVVGPKITSTLFSQKYRLCLNTLVTQIAWPNYLQFNRDSKMFSTSSANTRNEKVVYAYYFHSILMNHWPQI